MKGKCWLIGESGQRWWPDFQVASRGLPVQSCRYGAVADIAATPGVLIAIDFDNFQRLDPSALVSLREKIQQGATCYIRGGLIGRQYSLRPVAPVAFEVAANAESPGHTFTSQGLLPAALRGESIEHRCNVATARGLPAMAQPLVLARSGDGSIAAPLFAINLGAGVIICDLANRQNGGSVKGTSPQLLRRLENPAGRLDVIGALVAFDRALGRDAERPVACDIVLDDRPINLDYFNVCKVRSFLDYVTSRCPGIHVDFGWTPDQNRPSRRYVEAIKHFNAGFVWHGLLRHIDHRSIARPEVHFARGQRLVKEISQQYQVRFQPVMIFPYEKDTAGCVALLKREGFIAKAQTLDELVPGGAISQREPSGSSEHSAGTGFATLLRDSIETLTRDRMLARSALGMPIIAAAHPRNAGLRRLSKFRPGQQAGEEFNDLLDFATTKKLRPQSLEQLAYDQIANSEDSALVFYHESATEQPSGGNLVAG